MSLRLARTLELPNEAVTDTLAILGRRGSGKTFAAKRLAEEMLEAHQQIAAIDPTGVWWGLRSSASGKSAGYEVVILGGNHGDVPLEPTAGELVADLIVDTRISVVLDVSLMKKGERVRFLTAFAERLYHRKATARSPIHLFVDEAHAFVPQREDANTRRMVGAGEDLVQMGRSRGIGVTLISQRPAVINKNVLSQVAGLICFQLTGSHDRKALNDWIDNVGDSDRRKEALATLSGLDVGHALVWVPHLQVFEAVHVSKARTFDSSATPKLGEQLAPPAAVADVDLSALQEAMAETIERHDAQDPKKLQRQIRELLEIKADLERQIAEGSAEVRAEPVEVPVEVLTPPPIPAELKEIPGSLREVVAGMRDLGNRMLDQATDLASRAGEIDEFIDGNDVEWERFLADRQAPPPRPQAPAPVAPARRPPPAPRGPLQRGEADPDADTVKLKESDRKVLNVLAQYPQGRTHGQLAMLAGYSPKASTISSSLSRLRKVGYVTRGTDLPQITELGMENCTIEPLPTGPELLALWRSNSLLKQSDRTVLDLLVEQPDLEWQHDQMAEHAGYSPDASTISSSMSRLRKLELAEGWHLHPTFREAIGL